MKKVLRSFLLHCSMLCILVSVQAFKVSAQTIPVPDHIVVAILENHAYTQVIGSSAAPKINALASDPYTALFTQSYAIEHPSQPNYLDLYAGCNQGVTDDNVPASNPFTTANLGRQLIDSGRTFITYSEDLPSVGYNGATSGAYARKHNPATNWMGTGTNQIPTTTNQPFTAFPTNFDSLPTVCYVVPNQNNDMHNGSDPTRITTADNWIYNNLNNYIQWAKTHNSLFILTFDEDNSLNGNRIATIFTGQMVLAGQYSETINHYTVLRTIEAIYGLPYACNAASATTITDVWTTCRVTGSTISNVLCFGDSNGSATVSPMNSSPPYTYAWSPSVGAGQTISNLSAGMYTCSVTDALGCTKATVVTITQPTVLTAVGSPLYDVLCFNGSDGSARVTPGGGTAPYTYLWSPSGGNGQTASNLSAGDYTVTVTDANGCTNTSTATIAQPTVMTAVGSTLLNVLCNGGSNGAVRVNAGGGTPAYTYSWSPSGGTGQTASNLPAGNYTVTVIDNHGCLLTTTATVTQPTALTAAGSTEINVFCNGGNNGSATVVSNGGTPGYNYIWSPSGGNGQTANNLIAGTYTVTVTDGNGCTITSMATITEPTALNAVGFTISNASCYNAINGSVSITSNGGTPGYTYLWSPSGQILATATNLSAGIYTATVTDSNGCSITSTAIITEPAQLISTISVSSDVSCNGGDDGSAVVTPGGGIQPYTYLWLPSGGSSQTTSVLAANTYSVLVTDANGCITSSSVTITEPPILTANISNSTDASCSSCNDGSAEVVAGGGVLPYNYLWSPSGGNTSSASNLLPGNYTCCITDGNGCSTCTSVIISYPTAVNEISGASAISIYPNPAHNTFTISINKESGIRNWELGIYNVMGRVVYQQKLNSPLFIFDFQFSPGVYFVKVQSGGKVYTQKLVIE